MFIISVVKEYDLYQSALDDYGESPRSLRWVSYQSMATRFRYLVEGLDIKGRSILDAGCGMGDLLPYLHTKTDDFSYLGMDINPNLIKIAKKRYEGHSFAVGNPFNGQLDRRFDLVISSGVMNTNVKGWQKHRKTMIKNAFELASEAFAFNMAGALAKAQETPKIAYANAADILSYCAKLTPKLIFKSHYLPDDFTIVMFK
jgi:SAM-dependent methyltransferase